MKEPAITTAGAPGRPAPGVRPALSVVVPVYDEAEVLPLFAARLRPALETLGETYEVLVVDDGSADATPALLERLRREWPALRVVRLRANSGHQAALSAGLVRARGEWVVSLDADLQDPPEVILEMLEKWKQGYDVVYGRRRSRVGESWFKLQSAKWFSCCVMSHHLTDLLLTVMWLPNFDVRKTHLPFLWAWMAPNSERGAMKLLVVLFGPSMRM